MVLGLFPGTGQAAAENLFEASNPGFENWYWGSEPLYKCSNWKINADLRSGVITKSTDIKRSGEAALRIAPEEGSRSLIYQEPTTVVPGAEYTFDFWFYGISGKVNNGNVQIEFEFYALDGEGNSVSLGRDITFRPEIAENETWVQLSASVETPVDSEALQMRPIVHIYAPGGGYMDDVCLKMTGEPKLGQASTDRIFYYREEIGANAVGEVTVTLNPYYTPETYTAGAALYGPDGTLLAESEREQFSEEGKASLSFPLALLTEPKQAYTVTARIFSASGDAAPLWTEDKAVYVYNRPLAFDENGNYRRMRYDAAGNPLLENGEYVVEDEIFQPTLAYHVSQPKADTQDVDNMYLQAQNAGVNVVQLSYYYADPERIERALDKCREYGLMGLVCLYRSNVPAGNVTEKIADSTGALVTNAENTKKVVEIAGNHPATFAYAVKDEPFSHMTPTMEADLENSYKIIRDIDDVHPVYIVDTADVVRLAKYADICAIDPYAKSAARSGTEAAYHTKRAVEAAKSKPVYVIMQAFCYGDTDDDGTHDYFPEWREMRHMWYQSLAAGAKSVGYYCFDNPWGEIGDSETTINETRVWADMTAFADGEMEKSYRFFRESTLLASFENDAGWVQKRAWNGETYAVVLSKSSAAQAPVSLPAFEAVIAEVYLGTGGSVADIEAGAWTLTLPESGADVYRLQGSGLFVSQNGHVVSAVSPGSRVTVQAALEAESGRERVLAYALYSEAGGQTELLRYTVLAEGTGGLDFSQTLTLPETESPATLKLFVLSHDHLSPLTPTATVKIGA